MRYFSALLFLIFVIGCASVQVKAPKEPIKVDIAMRIDVYQHVQQDIDAIESLVSGGQPKVSEKPISFIDSLVETAYAEDGLGPEIEAAALSRKARYSDLISMEQKGIIGENKKGLVEARDSSRIDASVIKLINDENNDRQIIYKGVAAKNGTSVSDVQKLYAKRLQKDAPAGTPVEDPDTGTWSLK